MESIDFGRWKLSCDPESTRKAYAVVPMGGPEECGCKPCLNFAAARDQIYGPDVRTLLGKLGVSPDRESRSTTWLVWNQAGTFMEAGFTLSVR